MTMEKMNLRRQALDEVMVGWSKGMSLDEALGSSAAYTLLDDEEKSIVICAIDSAMAEKEETDDRGSEADRQADWYGGPENV